MKVEIKKIMLRCLMAVAAVLNTFNTKAAGSGEVGNISRDTSEIETMLKFGHRVKFYTVSYDEKYLFTTSDNEICIWDFNNLMLLKTLPVTSGSVWAHPTDSRLIYINIKNSYLRSTPACAKYKIVNWQDGTTVGFTNSPPLFFMPTDYKIALHKNEVLYFFTKTYPSVPIGYVGGYNFDIGSVHTNRNDSLLVTSGMLPQLWDLKHAKLLHNIRYYRYLNHQNENERLDIQDVKKTKIKENKHPWSADFCHSYFLPGCDRMIFGGVKDTVTIWETDVEKDRVVLRREIDGIPEPTTAMSFKGDTIIAMSDRALYRSIGLNRFEELKSASTFSEITEYTAISRPYSNGRFLIGGSVDASGTSIYGGSQLFEFSYDTLRPLRWLNEFGNMTVSEIKISSNEKFAAVVQDFKHIGIVSLLDMGTPRLEYVSSLEITLEEDEYITACEILADKIIMGATSHGNTYFWQLPDTHCFKKSQVHHGRINVITVSSDRTRFFTGDYIGQITMWDADRLEPIVSMYQIMGLNDSGTLIVTPDNYYKATSNASEFINFVKDGKAYDFEQFDLRNNRPDIILERLGGDPGEVALLHKAWKKRLQRAGVKEQDLAADYHVPEVIIANRNSIPAVISDTNLSLELEFKDAEVELKDFTLFLNGVPVKRGELKGKEGKVVLEVELASGLNDVAVKCQNARGTGSMRESVRVVRPVKEETKPAAYVVAIGVSDYENSKYNLEYACKDAEDFSSAIADGYGDCYSSIKTLVIRNEEFDNNSGERIRDFLSCSNRDDTVILFYAGHGVLDSEFDYYLATGTMDFRNPKAGGVLYEDFVGLFEGTRALERYCFIDACHSGEIDKEDYMAVNTIAIPEGEQLLFRSAGGDIKAKAEEVNRVNALIEELFNDVRWGSGASVITSAGAAQLAVEGPQWNNGLFTYCLKKGLQSNEADFDGDGRVSFEEMISFATEKVREISGGRQVPTFRSRIINSVLRL